MINAIVAIDMFLVGVMMTLIILFLIAITISLIDWTFETDLKPKFAKWFGWTKKISNKTNEVIDNLDKPDELTYNVMEPTTITKSVKTPENISGYLNKKPSSYKGRENERKEN